MTEKLENDGGVDSTTQPDSAENTVSPATASPVDNNGDIGDEDVVAGEKAGEAGEDDEYYEYYYVYYDEEGNVVNVNSNKTSDELKTATTTVAPPAKKQGTSKLQEISLASSNGDSTGDTPTIYAGIKNPDQHGDDEKSEEEEEGMSIFGIPIPKIPISLSFGLAPALVALLARFGRKIPIVVTYHGSEPERIGSFGAIAKRCDLVITPSYASGEDLVRIGGVPRDKLKVIGLGLTPAPQDTDEEAAALRQELLGDGTHLIVTLARMIRQKGIDILIECIARLKETHPGYRFVLAGDGPDEDALMALAREKGIDKHLTYIGRTSRPHLHLKAADLFLLTSRWEALPFTIVEAFQVGTPCVATACSGVVELIDDQVGAVVPIGDVPEICRAVVTVLSDPDRLAEMGNAALARSTEDRFDPDWVHNVFEQTYLDLVADKA